MKFKQTDVIVTNNGVLKSTPFYMVVESRKLLTGIDYVFVNKTELPVEMIKLQRIKMGQYQLVFTNAVSDPLELEKEKRRKRKVDIQAKEDAKDVLEITKEMSNEQKTKLKREKIMDLLNIKGQTYHAPPSKHSISPTASQLQRMNLEPGNNFFIIGFSLNGILYEATINVWFFPAETKFVISDIDGTITRFELGDMFKFSDRLHADVIATYKEIAKNGYVFLYLTARSFTQTEKTRSFLTNVGAPAGPVLTCPIDFRGIVRAYLTRQVTELKLNRVLYIMKIFPESPFYGAFGNKPHDQLVYRKAAVKNNNIFTVVKDGSLQVALRFKDALEEFQHVDTLTRNQRRQSRRLSRRSLRKSI